MYNFCLVIKMTTQTPITPELLIDLGRWETLCDIRGWNPYIIAEGQMDHDEVICLTYDEIKTLDL